MATFGNSSASSLLKTAEAQYNRTQTYNDSIAAYEYELSDKTADDYSHYQTYLKGRIDKTTDPSKQLSLQKAITSAYRTFNSSEIQRASLAVNYGDISKTDKYKQMYGLLQQAYDNGDMELAGNIESQMASLSVQIQNEADAAARASSAAGTKAYNDSVAAAHTQINDLENKIDRAYQTGQPLVVDGKEQFLDAASYALNRASILQAKYQLLSQQAANDPKYADDLSSLQKSPEWRGLIDSGIVQFDSSGNPVATDGVKNLAVSFSKDQYGNTNRTFTSPDLKDGKIQYGLAQNADDSGGKKQVFVADRQLNNTITDPSLKSRVAYDVNQLKTNDNKTVPGVGSYNDLLSGNQVLVQTEGKPISEGGVAGYRATAFNGKKEKRTTEQATEDLKALVDSQQNDGGHAKPTSGGLFDLGNAGQTYASFGKNAGNVLNFIDRQVGIQGNIHKQRAAEAARQQAEAQAAENSLRYATTPAARAAAPAPVRSYVPVAPKAQVYLPTPIGVSPAGVFNAAKAQGKSTAAAIGNAVGYNF